MDLERGYAGSNPPQQKKSSNAGAWAVFGSVFLFLAAAGAISGLAGTSSRAPGAFDHLHGFCADIQPISHAEFLERGDKLAALLPNYESDVFITEPGDSMLYFADLKWSLSERPFLWIKFAATGATHLLIPAFELETVEELLKGNPYEGKITVHTWAETDSPYEILFDEVFQGNADLRVMVEPDIRYFIPHGIAQAMGRPGAVRFGFEALRELRMVKSPAEIAIIRCVNEATKAGIKAVAERLSDSTTEDQATAWVRQAFSEAGLVPAFALVAFGKNAAYPHGSNLRTVLRRGDLVLIDAGASLYGYVSDVTRTFPYGSVRHLTQKQKDVWHVVQRAQQAALDLVKPGVEFAALDAAARAVIEDAGWGPQFGHRLGHGIGLSVHEPPYAVGNDHTLLEENMTFTVEPGVYLVEELGVRHEDVVRVTATGYETMGRRMESLENPFP